MRYLALLTGVALLFCSSAWSAQSNDVNFGGTWVLNEATSIGGFVAAQNLQFKPGTLKIDQSTKKMVVREFQADPYDGSTAISEMAYRLDGGKSYNDADNVNNESHAVWSDNGNRLTITTKTTALHQGRKYSYNKVEVFTLENGSLIVEITFDNPTGESKYEAAYNRKI